jgi:hypothetical protein
VRERVPSAEGLLLGKYLLLFLSVAFGKGEPKEQVTKKEEGKEFFAHEIKASPNLKSDQNLATIQKAAGRKS